MASDPMTLTEFQAKLRRLDLYAGSGEAIDMEDAIWADVLRLLAGERARCIDAIRDETRDAVNAGTTPQFVRVPQTAGDIARDALADPTTDGLTFTGLAKHYAAALCRIADSEAMTQPPDYAPELYRPRPIAAVPPRLDRILGWCVFPAGAEWRECTRHGARWKARGCAQEVTMWLPIPPAPEPPQTAQEIARLQIQRIENGYYGISTAPDILVALHSIAGMDHTRARLAAAEKALRLIIERGPPAEYERIARDALVQETPSDG